MVDPIVPAACGGGGWARRATRSKLPATPAAGSAPAGVGVGVFNGDSDHSAEVIG